MRKPWRTGLFCLLAFSLFCQGLAAAGMVACRGGVHPLGPALPTAPAVVAPGATDAHAPCHQVDHIEPSGVSANIESTNPATSVHPDGCSACAACCLLTALPIDSQVPAATTARAAPPPPPPAIAVSFLSDGLDRPPRSLAA